jgi:transcriptional regulator with XRE-family HTH domain
MASFGEYLKQQRKKKGLKQEDLAHALDVSNTYIHQMETGKIDAPGLERCQQLAQALKVDVQELWELARRERLAKYAERAGVSLEELFNELGSEVDGISLAPAEQSLIRLFRKLDAQTKKDFNGLIAMLFRHFPEEEIQRELEKYLKSA